MLELFLLLGSQFIIGTNPFKSDENRLTISFWSCFLGVVFLSAISTLFLNPLLETWSLRREH